MSVQNNNPLLIKSVNHSNRYVNNSNSNISGIGMPNNRKMPKSMGNFSSSNLSVNSYNSYNTNSSTQSQTYLPSMLKNMPTTNANKKYSTDYHQAVRFDYADAFLHNSNNIEFFSRISQMQRLQMETVEWERKKRLSKKKSNNQSTNSLANSNNSNNKTNSGTSNPTTNNTNLLINATNLND
ncbi:unnamed protein product [Brachionus calyciflorus]|uniref:Uncharacterized protein n=1 Tax=Brachionus calyciflorus TaxID=104777 RepID=A0A813M7A6_9BILA|nr:unnamed protein product [Brachionus calyciflorus]